MQTLAALHLHALGGMFSERSGVINIALEGIMVIGALFSCLTLKGFHNSGFGVEHPIFAMFLINKSNIAIGVVK
mgnify:CR=1 FL=1